jgi:hypothetical protein
MTWNACVLADLHARQKAIGQPAKMLKANAAAGTRRGLADCEVSPGAAVMAME